MNLGISILSLSTYEPEPGPTLPEVLFYYGNIWNIVNHYYCCSRETKRGPNFLPGNNPSVFIRAIRKNSKEKGLHNTPIL